MAKKTLSLFTFIDALGYEILKSYNFLDDVLVTKRPLGTIFGYSSTCDPTIITGKLPREHDHFSFFAYNPAKSPFRWLAPLSILPSSLTDRGRVRHHISKAVKRMFGYTGYFQLYSVPFSLLPQFEYTETRDLYEPGGINSGATTIFDRLRAEQIPFYLSDWRASETKNLATLQQAIGEGEIRFAYLYMAQMDAILHQYGSHTEHTEKKLAWYERQIRAILDAADRQYAEVHLHLFSDHGMTNCHTVHNLMKQVNALGLKFGKDYAVMYDSTMARFWFLDDKAESRIRNVLENDKYGHCVSDDELARWGCDFPNNRYGDLFYLLDPGVLLCPSFMGISPLAGMHGYAPEDRDSVASFSSNLPFEENDPRLPGRLEDLYTLMEDEIDNKIELTPKHNQAKATPEPVLN